MRRIPLWILLFATIAFTSSAQAQNDKPTAGQIRPSDERERSAVPHLMKFTGAVKDAQGNPRTGVVGITFALYDGQEGGAALWMETQNVELDAQGHYTILLGRTKNEGLSPELFVSGESRWLGVKVALPGETEQPRVLLVSVPYAMKAGDAQTLEGRRVSEFVLKGEIEKPKDVTGDVASDAKPAANSGAAPGREPPPVVRGLGATNFVPKFLGEHTVGISSLFEAGGNVGIGTTSPAHRLDVFGNIRISGLGNGLIFPDGTMQTSAAGSVGTGGGTVTQVNAGAGLSGGPITTFGTLSLDTAFTDARYSQVGGSNTFTANQVFTGRVKFGDPTFFNPGPGPNLSGDILTNGGMVFCGQGLSLVASGNVMNCSGTNNFAMPPSLAGSLNFASGVSTSPGGTTAPHIFSWVAEALNNGTPNATSRFGFYTATNGQSPVFTGLSLDLSGHFQFAPGQTFPGGTGITAVNTPPGSGLTGGGNAGALNLSLQTNCSAGEVLVWNGNSWGCANPLTNPPQPSITTATAPLFSTVTQSGFNISSTFATPLTDGYLKATDFIGFEDEANRIDTGTCLTGGPIGNNFFSFGAPLNPVSGTISVDTTCLGGFFGGLGSNNNWTGTQTFNGNITAEDLILTDKGTATASAGSDSHAVDFFASVWDSSTVSPFSVDMRTQVDAADNNTSSPDAAFQWYFSIGNNPLATTGAAVETSGVVRSTGLAVAAPNSPRQNAFKVKNNCGRRCTPGAINVFQIFGATPTTPAPSGAALFTAEGWNSNTGAPDELTVGFQANILFNNTSVTQAVLDFVAGSPGNTQPTGTFFDSSGGLHVPVIHYGDGTVQTTAGGGGGGVTSVNSLTGPLTLALGSIGGIDITTSGQTFFFNLPLCPANQTEVSNGTSYGCAPVGGGSGVPSITGSQEIDINGTSGGSSTGATTIALDFPKLFLGTDPRYVQKNLPNNSSQTINGGLSVTNFLFTPRASVGVLSASGPSPSNAIIEGDNTTLTGAFADGVDGSAESPLAAGVKGTNFGTGGTGGKFIANGANSVGMSASGDTAGKFTGGKNGITVTASTGAVIRAAETGSGLFLYAGEDAASTVVFTLDDTGKAVLKGGVEAGCAPPPNGTCQSVRVVDPNGNQLASIDSKGEFNGHSLHLDGGNVTFKDAKGNLATSFDATTGVTTFFGPVTLGNTISSGPALVVSGDTQLLNLSVTGTLSKPAGSFKIDHPLDPEHKFLYHSFVESPDMKNVYDGVARLDADGRAWVELPAYFEALNKDFRYQLTAIGAPGPNLYVAQEITGNRFQIAGGKPGSKVSWQVTGIRKDPYAEKNRIQTEVDKPAAEQGTYLHPEVYGLPANRGVVAARNQKPEPRIKETEEKPSPFPK